jgi:hypothetical protein
MMIVGKATHLIAPALNKAYLQFFGAQLSANQINEKFLFS